MKNLQYLLLVFLMLFSSKEIVAQKDSITAQRKARKLLRQGNDLYQKQKFTDASVAYRKALGNNHIIWEMRCTKIKTLKRQFHNTN